MSGLTYSRTSGTLILPGTWEAVQAFHGQDSVIPVEDRLSWDEATTEQRHLFTQLATQQRLRPPRFLRFNLASTAGTSLSAYPGAGPRSLGRRSDGFLSQASEKDACERLGLLPARLAQELGKFSGPVALKLLPEGQKIYRTVGLIALNAAYGAVTNKLLGEYWEPHPPSVHPSIEAWRAATAVKAEWNGDYGYLEVTLPVPVWALVGATGMQVVDADRDLALPGGGEQIFIPELPKAAPAVAERVASTALVDLLLETRFAGDGQEGTE